MNDLVPNIDQVRATTEQAISKQDAKRGLACKKEILRFAKNGWNECVCDNVPDVYLKELEKQNYKVKRRSGYVDEDGKHVPDYALIKW